MKENDKKRQELLQELARRFRDSSNNLKHVARRIDKAARTHNEMCQRINQAGKHLRDCMDEDASVMPWTYLEFVEFSTAKEFEKFKAMDVITNDEINAVDFDSLCTQLLAK